MVMKNAINRLTGRKPVRLILLVSILLVMHLKSPHESFSSLLSNISAICALIEFVSSDESKSKH